MSPRIGLDLNTILKAATEIADAHGIEEVTLASLAKKLNVRSPSLYNHIDGLPGLRKKLAVYGLELLYSQWKRAAAGRSGEDAVHEIAKAYIAFARTHPGLYEATLLAPDSWDHDVQRAGGKMVDLALGVLKDFELEGEPAIHAVRGLRSILHGFASLEQKGGFGLPLDLDVSVRLIIDTFLAGIHAIKQNEKKYAK
ncbi:TetR/AcrR family transcriptional regulator [Fictibacillus gelatini]|uniref:TetR/AcrR family transcriptional regulator n=1 Tax=Fictibacillus gelatini TaxID=225985 RepID=UPI00040E2273|nr:TetR/AcrR family transcriptional regulator [Fictibacillus gelatini]